MTPQFFLRSSTSFAARALPCLLFTVVAFALPFGIAVAQEAVGTALYDTNPKHLWNRIHCAFHFRLENEIRFHPDKQDFDPNELDPLLWTQFSPTDTFLLAGTSHRRAVELLDEFLASNGDKLIADPLKRALLQRDLWAVFDWVTSPVWSRSDDTKFQSERKAIYTGLARILPRLALSTDEIEKLPDNYAAAVSSKKHSPAFDPSQKNRAYLPADLWNPNGPWVLLAKNDGPLAQKHVQFFGGRSSFFAFLKLPAGRDQTLGYIDQLQKWRADGAKGSTPPQFPALTQLALARRMLLLSRTGDISPTRLTEAVQLRVLHEPAEYARGAQTFHEFRLRRHDLINSRNGGLYSVPDEDCERDDLLFLGPGSLNDRVPILASCRHCHSAPGILSVNSFTDSIDAGRRGRWFPSTVEKEQRTVIEWKRQQYSWGLLEGLQNNQ